MTVMPVPENDSVDVPPASKLVPVTVTFPVQPCSSLVGAMLAGAGGGSVVVTVTITSPKFTAALASNPPAIVVPVPATVIEATARIVPTKVLVEPIAAELPTAQKTLLACPPFMTWITDPALVVSVVAIWKIQTAFGSPWASKVKVPPDKENVPAAEVYTPE